MRLSALTRWIVAGVLAGLETSALGGDPNTGFVYNSTNGTFSTVDVPGAVTTWASGINNAGHIVGYFASNSQARGFLDAAGTFSTIDVPSGAPAVQGIFPHSINNTGQVVGWIEDINPGNTGGLHGFLDAGGTFSTIDVPGAYYTIAWGINDAQQIVGEFLNLSSGLLEQGFLYAGGTFSTIDVPGASRTRAIGINNAGQIVGSYDDVYQITHGFLYSGGTFTTIDPPGGGFGISATGINDAGSIVGSYGVSGGGIHSFLYAGGTFSSIDVPGAQIYAEGINGAGLIVGSFNNLGSVPEAGSLALFSVGLLALGLAWRHRRAARIH
jgi:probable HAF family extracellular repeat protein